MVTVQGCQPAVVTACTCLHGRSPGSPGPLIGETRLKRSSLVRCLYVPRKRSLRIQLTPDILADDIRLGEVIDKVLLADRTLRRLYRQIVRRQRALKATVSDDQWRLYMLIEELFNDRWARALDIVARQSYAAGRQTGRRRK